jgi:hypothetical protein
MNTCATLLPPIPANSKTSEFRKTSMNRVEGEGCPKARVCSRSPGAPSIRQYVYCGSPGSIRICCRSAGWGGDQRKKGPPRVWNTPTRQCQHTRVCPHHPRGGRAQAVQEIKKPLAMPSDNNFSKKKQPLPPGATTTIHADAAAVRGHTHSPNSKGKQTRAPKVAVESKCLDNKSVYPDNAADFRARSRTILTKGPRTLCRLQLLEAAPD